MKNQIVSKVTQNKLVSKVLGEIGKFYLTHEGTILTTGSIGFSIATTAVTYRNADKIKSILADASYILKDLKESNASKEEINGFYASTLKELAPLAAPIVIFQTATIACSVLSKKRSDRIESKLAETAGALSIAQAAITQYQAFQKEAEESLGEKKYAKLVDDINKNRDVDGRRFTSLASEGAPGEILMIDKYSGRPFWSTIEKVEYAAKELGRMISPNGGYDQVSINDYYDLIGNNDLTPNELAEKFGYLESFDTDIRAHFSDTHYVFPNGTRIPAFEVFLYPSPECLYND